MKHLGRKMAVGIAVATLGFVTLVPSAIADNEQGPEKADSVPGNCFYVDGPYSSEDACMTSTTAAECRHDGYYPKCSPGWSLYCCYQR